MKMCFKTVWTNSLYHRYFTNKMKGNMNVLQTIKDKNKYNPRFPVKSSTSHFLSAQAGILIVRDYNSHAETCECFQHRKAKVVLFCFLPFPPPRHIAASRILTKIYINIENS